MTTRTTTDDTGAPQIHRVERQKSTEAKSAYKTTEFIVYVLAVLGVLIASMIVDQSFGADPAWRYVTYWTCVGSVDCFRLRTVRGKESSATNEPDLPTGVSPRSYPAGKSLRCGSSHPRDRPADRCLRWHPQELGEPGRD